MKNIIALLLIATSLSGADYYISSTGDNANAGTLGSPWRTFEKGMTNLTAGDTLYVVGGPFTDANDFVNCAWLNNSGTDYGGGAITVAGYGGSKVTLAPTGTGNVVNFNNISFPRHHVIVSNFVCDATSRGSDVDTVKVTEGSYAIKMINCDITGSTDGHGFHCSPGGSGYPSGSLNWLVNCDIYDNGLTSQDHNVYIRTISNIVEQCTIRDIASGYGIHSNDANSNYNIFRQNYFTNISNRAAIILAGGGGTNYVYNNTIAYCWSGILTFGEKDSYIYNNTIDLDNALPDDQWGIYIYGNSTNIIIKNNLIYDTLQGIRIEGTGGATNIVATHNAVYQWSSAAINDVGGYSTVSDNITDNTAGTYQNVIVTWPPVVVADYKLKAGAAPIAAGTDLSAILTTDYGGNTRVDWDIGAWAYTADDPAAAAIRNFLKLNVNTVYVR